MSDEAGFQRTVVDTALMLGWQVMHVRRSVNGTKGARWTTATSVPGWPDLVLWKPGVGVLFRELKSDTGRLTTEQRAVLGSLEAAGADVAVWRPKDWKRIESILRRRADSRHSPATVEHGA